MRRRPFSVCAVGYPNKTRMKNMSFIEIGRKLINLDHVKAVRFSDRNTTLVYIDGSDEHIKEGIWMTSPPNWRD
jgi:hypothetical protein